MYFVLYFIIIALTGADGKKYRVRYTADEFGYHPVTELEEIDPIQWVILSGHFGCIFYKLQKTNFRPIVPQTTPASDRIAKKLYGTGFGFSKNYNAVQTTKPLTSQRFGPFSGPGSSLTTKQFNQGNGPYSAAVSSFNSKGFGQENVRNNNGPFSGGISSLTHQRFGEGNIETNGPFS